MIYKVIEAIAQEVDEEDLPSITCPSTTVKANEGKGFKIIMKENSLHLIIMKKKIHQLIMRKELN